MRVEAEADLAGPVLDLAWVEAEIAGTEFAGQMRHLRSIGSTNQVALEAAAGGAQAGVWVADEQTAGRGRGGHAWHSVAGDGLYVSALVTPALALEEAPRMTLAAGLAVQAAIAEATGLAVDLRWPNDLMFERRKCGGILVESVVEPAIEGAPARLRYAVLGVGVNVNHAGFPDELRYLATSLRLESGRSFAREPLLGALLRCLTRELRALERDPAQVLTRFAAASTWVRGKRVKVDEDGGYTGLTCGLDARGFLQVMGDDGRMRKVLSGGVRPA